MHYKRIVTGKFKDRPNRFIANIAIGDKIETVHVKNTGRCKVFTVFFDRLQSFLARKAVSFHKGINQRRTDKGY